MWVPIGVGEGALGVYWGMYSGVSDVELGIYVGAYWGRGGCIRGLWGMYSVSVRVH